MILIMLWWNDDPCFATPDGWQQVWGDEFEGDQLDIEKWEAVTTTKPHNQERQAYHPSRVSVADGKLKIIAVDKPFGDKAYTSGKVVSHMAQRYGRWEIRAKLPSTRGTWPAIWLCPESTIYRWPSQGEIDIMENRGDQPFRVSSAFHYGTNPPYKHFYKAKPYEGTDLGDVINFHQQFHTYTTEWEARQIHFFVDDVLFWTLQDDEIDHFLAGQTAPMKTILNVAVGGQFLKKAQPDETSSWPQQMLVDYVRVYIRTPAKVANDLSNQLHSNQVLALPKQSSQKQKKYHQREP